MDASVEEATALMMASVEEATTTSLVAIEVKLSLVALPPDKLLKFRLFGACDFVIIDINQRKGHI